MSASKGFLPLPHLIMAPYKVKIRQKCSQRASNFREARRIGEEWDFFLRSSWEEGARRLGCWEGSSWLGLSPSAKESLGQESHLSQACPLKGVEDGLPAVGTDWGIPCRSMGAAPFPTITSQGRMEELDWSMGRCTRSLAACSRSF